MVDNGANDPALSELLGHRFYREHFKGKRLFLLVKAHLRRSYDVNDEINNGHRPLNIALNHGLSDISLLLLENGADFQNKDKSGLNAFELALIRELYDVAYKIYKSGYQYTPRHTNRHLKVPHQNLYRFDLQYFK